MDRPVSVFVRNGTYSVCTAVAILCHGVDRERAQIAIGDCLPEATVQEINQLLNHPSDAATFRATWASAVSGTLQFLESQVNGLPTTETTDQLAEQVATVGDSVNQLRAELEFEQQRADEFRAQLKRERRDAEIAAEKAAKKLRMDKLCESVAAERQKRREKLWGKK